MRRLSFLKLCLMVMCSSICCVQASVSFTNGPVIDTTSIPGLSSSRKNSQYWATLTINATTQVRCIVLSPAVAISAANLFATPSSTTSILISMNNNASASFQFSGLNQGSPFQIICAGILNMLCLAVEFSNNNFVCCVYC